MIKIMRHYRSSGFNRFSVIESISTVHTLVKKDLTRTSTLIVLIAREFYPRTMLRRKIKTLRCYATDTSHFEAFIASGGHGAILLFSRIA